LRAILPDLAAIPLHFLTERLREQSFRWPVDSLPIHRARDYQSKAASHGFSFVIEKNRCA
jgi:hypothetical protein